LKWAFEGKLTNGNVKEGEFPKGWQSYTLGNVIKTIDGDRGSNYPKKNEFYEQGYCLFLSTKNVREDRFVFDENLFISKEKDEILRGGKLQLNDVVVTTRGTLGNVALYDEKIPFKNVRINSGMLILRVLNTFLDQHYLMKFVSSPFFGKQLSERQSGTAQPQIPANVLREIELPIPPTLEEQHRIVAEIESRLSVCNKIEESIENSLKQAESLRQSILKKAFEGKLVAQNPNDEPASVLLARIKTERGSKKVEISRPPQPRKKKAQL
jgi:type I restriction enzyme, S subunit